MGFTEPFFKKRTITQSFLVDMSYAKVYVSKLTKIVEYVYMGKCYVRL
jgi:hypothetical protein